MENDCVHRRMNGDCMARGYSHPNIRVYPPCIYGGPGNYLQDFHECPMYNQETKKI